MKCERPLSRLGAHDWRMAQYGGNGQCAVVGCSKIYTCCTTGHISMGCVHNACRNSRHSAHKAFIAFARRPSGLVLPQHAAASLRASDGVRGGPVPSPAADVAGTPACILHRVQASLGCDVVMAVTGRGAHSGDWAFGCVGGLCRDDNWGRAASAGDHSAAGSGGEGGGARPHVCLAPGGPAS